MIFAVVGPSGAGKDTLLAGAVAASPGLHWARRVVTRPAQPGGEPFQGVDAETFARRLAAGEFALHWQAHGLRYGITHAELTGERVIFNGSRQAIGAAITALPGLRVVRITAPSRVLAERLAARGRESREDIEARLARASYDLPEGVDVVDVVNDSTPETGVTRLLAALGSVRS